MLDRSDGPNYGATRSVSYVRWYCIKLVGSVLKLNSGFARRDANGHRLARMKTFALDNTFLVKSPPINDQVGPSNS